MQIWCNRYCRPGVTVVMVPIKEKENCAWTGFIAQEVEEAARNAAFSFSGVDKPRNQLGVYGLRYAEFVVPLVKAVQEQQAIIEMQQKTIDMLLMENKQLKTLSAQVEILSKSVEVLSGRKE